MLRQRRAALAVALAFLGAGPAAAQNEPRPVHIVVPAPPGGTLDATARILAQRLAAVTGEPHVVENRPGANTHIGVEHVVRAAPDGRTLLLNGPSMILNPLLQKGAYSPFQDLRPVAAVTAEHYVLLASNGLGAADVRGLERLARARPGGLNCGASPGPFLLACEQLKVRLGGALTSVSFAGVGPALTALAGGHIDVTFATEAVASRLLEAGQAQLLAASVRQGAGAQAGVPLIGEIWPDFVIDAVQGIYAPAGTPEARVRQLQAQLSQVLAEPETQARLRGGGAEPAQAATSADAFVAQLRWMSGRYAKVVQALGLSRP